MLDIAERIEKNVDQLFSKVNDLSEGIAVNAAILPRIEKKLDDLPCENHEKKITKLDKEIYADKYVRTRIAGALGVLGTVLATIAILGQILGWF